MSAKSSDQNAGYRPTTKGDRVEPQGGFSRSLATRDFEAKHGHTGWDCTAESELRHREPEQERPRIAVLLSQRLFLARDHGFEGALPNQSPHMTSIVSVWPSA
jgi:hypothetical protein